jgi:hypothetical protein
MEVTGRWRKLYKEEVHNSTLFPIYLFLERLIMEDEMGEVCSTHGKVKNMLAILE